MDKKDIKELLKKEIVPYLVGLRNEIADKPKDFLGENEIKGVIFKGEKGDDGYTPIADKDYPSEKTVFQFIKDNLPKKGKDYFTEKDIKDIVSDVFKLIPSKEELKGKDGLDGQVDYSIVESLAKPLIENKYKQIQKYIDDLTNKTIKAIENNKIPELSAEKIRNKLESLKGNARLDAKAIKGLENYMQTFIATSSGGGGGGGGSTTDLSGYVPYIGATSNLNLGNNSLNVSSITSPFNAFRIYNTGAMDFAEGLASITANGDGYFQNAITASVSANSSAGLSLNNNTGTTVALLGAGSGTGVTFYGGVVLNTMTSGSILFAGSSGLISQDNSNFFWDDANNRLGVGITKPQSSIHQHIASDSAIYTKYTNSSVGSTSTDGFDIGISSTGVAEIRNRELSGIQFFTNNVNYYSFLSNEPTLLLDSQGSNSANAGKIIMRTAGGSESVTILHDASANLFSMAYAANTMFSFNSLGTTIQTPSVATGGTNTLQLTANTWTNSTLVNKMLGGAVTLNQSGTAGFDIIDYSISQSAVGSGEKNLIRFNVNGSGRFTVDYLGRVAINKSLPATILGMVDIVTDGSLADTIPSIVAGKVVTSGNSLGASFRNLTGTTGNAMIEIAGITSGAARPVQLRTDSSGNFGVFTGSTAYSTIGTERFTILQGGNVGVGTNNPVSKFNVSSDGAFPQLVMSDNNYVGSGAHYYLQSSGGKMYIGGSADSGGAYTSLTDRITLDSVGNVGIGTTTPSARLHIISTTEQLRVGYDASIYWNATTAVTTGITTFNAVGGTTPSFIFSDPVSATTLKTTTAGGYISSDGSTGATGTFTTTDLKTVTVKDGIITSIV